MIERLEERDITWTQVRDVAEVVDFLLVGVSDSELREVYFWKVGRSDSSGRVYAIFTLLILLQMMMIVK